MPSAGKDAEKMGLSSITSGAVNAAATLENGLAVSYETNHATVI
jgi:hypothetical protein